MAADGRLHDSRRRGGAAEWFHHGAESNNAPLQPEAPNHIHDVASWIRVNGLRHG